MSRQIERKFFTINITTFSLCTIVYYLIHLFLDEKLKPLIIVAIFSLTEFYEPPTQVLTYYWQSENMVKLITKFMDTCKGLPRPPREFYRLLTLKRIIFKRFYLYNSLVCMFIHIWKASACSDKDLRFVCGIYVPLWLPIETNYFPVREILQIIEVIITYRLVLITVHQSIDAYILSELFEYKSKQLMELMHNTSLSREQHLGIVKQKLHDIVNYHQQLHECFGLIRDIICGIIAPGVTVFIPAAATQTVYFMRDFNIACLQISILTVFIFYICFDSIQRITDLGQIIQEAAYGMDWYEMDKEMNKDYIIFLMKLQIPLKMKSILFIIEKPFYLSMLRSIYSFFMMMLQMN
ncbi:uncharacterized protein LOC123318970 isoform X2 [Coccinella septempunctata]|uniref:uncharacterized protein LOC123318970 isoform X2 n=1 Tax=Coccinella septempunctata TaxID=41139 RepID=UPI001D080076|nr:uncharacterized protein LOC123318970 isoform X2 [Coccinella septempunctata]